MAPHLVAKELADIRRWTASGNVPTKVHDLHCKDRRKRKVKPVCLTALRKTLCGLTYKGGEETRGPKRKLSHLTVLALDVKRRALVDQIPPRTPYSCHS